MLFQFQCNLSSCLSALPFFLVALLATSAVVKVANIVAVKDGFLEAVVDNVVQEAQPPSSGISTTRLRRVLGQHLAKVLGTLAARVQAAEKV
jgi:hypothetical protein